ncbi:alpha/beta fold hydrolase [Streptomyces gibsoniae]|uniref:Alpha/beta hydrolase n=1 Tax=Streptomyces gibsoniae TaxID=3075529 RepID=A0ABU2U5J6_9ACTN|nr:alpha/beta hydrolase [Streptomyces sp. DSM 41699]MDT0468500.1 alpha/beta hydrolase [Streptomyces sp. DSM 41699]
MTNNGARSVVLTHGAWADGSSWSTVIDRLHGSGVRAYAAPLPLTSLTADVAALERVIDRVEGPVLLVGHAYAGAVIGSVRPERVAGLVYVAALAPDKGETVADVFHRGTPHPSAPELAPDGDGLIWLPDAAFSDAFAQDASPAQQALLTAVQRPIAVDCISTAVTEPVWRTRPSWYFVAEDDRMITAESQRYMAERMHATTTSVRAGHMPMITTPEPVADLILSALDATAE